MITSGARNREESGHAPRSQFCPPLLSPPWYNRKVMHLPLTPIRALYRAVDLYAKKTGIVSGDRRFTYAEFGERVERAAFGLLSEGVLPGDRVAYLSFDTHQLLEGYYSAPLIQIGRAHV